MKELRVMKENCKGIKKVFDRMQFEMTNKKIGFNLTIGDFYEFWKKSKKWDQQGKKANDLCLSRIDKNKPYELGNIEITKNYLSSDYNPQLRKHAPGDKRYFFTITPLGKFASLREAGDVHNCSAMAILKKVNDPDEKDYKKEFDT